MPLTPFQSDVLSVLVGNRSEASHVAGGMVLNAAEGSARYSGDFDLFHDLVADLVRHSERDVADLEAAGFEVRKVGNPGTWDQPSSFRKAMVMRDGERLELDWAHDSAFRFFPIVPDPLLGWRLHLFDMALNKALAVSARMETRDYVDILELGRIYPLEAIVWAACGKDPGFSPLSLLKMMQRFARIDPATLHEIQARDLDPLAMKEEWIAMSDRAGMNIEHLANTRMDIPIGVAFVDANGEPRWIGDDPTLRIHQGSIRGCWPVMIPPSGNP